MSDADYHFLLAGDTALVVEFGKDIDLRISAKIVSLARRLDELRVDGVIETVPTIRSLIIYYEPLKLSCATLKERIRAALDDVASAPLRARWWRFPVCYDLSLAPDLGHVAAQTGLSIGQVIERHTSVTYHVYMLGFLPGLAYMGDLVGELELPRRETPRPMIPGGSLGIASKMTCIYPMKTPCGWHLIGRSPVQLWDAGRRPCALLAAGDQVAFEPVSLREYERLLAKDSKVSLRECSLLPPA